MRSRRSCTTGWSCAAVRRRARPARCLASTLGCKRPRNRAETRRRRLVVSEPASPAAARRPSNQRDVFYRHNSDVPIRAINVRSLAKSGQHMLALSLTAFCEGFRMPAVRKRCRSLWRPASENLQRRKPREGVRGPGGALQWGLGSSFRAPTVAQLQRSGMSVAKWGFDVSAQQ
jgi:hypothetical protein